MVYLHFLPRVNWHFEVYKTKTLFANFFAHPVKAKGLKNNQNWEGVSITHDLTKQQCLAERVKEMELRKEAEEKNGRLLEDEKPAKVWRVVGGRGTRRVVLRDKEPPLQGCL